MSIRKKMYTPKQEARTHDSLEAESRLSSLLQSAGMKFAKNEVFQGTRFTIHNYTLPTEYRTQILSELPNVIIRQEEYDFVIIVPYTFENKITTRSKLVFGIFSKISFLWIFALAVLMIYLFYSTK